jgi:hypothetical protein
VELDLHCHNTPSWLGARTKAQGQLYLYFALLGIISVDFDLRDHLLISYFVFLRYCRGKVKDCDGTIHQLFMDFKNA